MLNVFPPRLDLGSTSTSLEFSPYRIHRSVLVATAIAIAGVFGKFRLYRTLSGPGWRQQRATTFTLLL